MRLRLALMGLIVLCLLMQMPVSGAPKSHIVGGVNFDELDLGGGHRLHNGTYTQDEPHIVTTLEGLYDGEVAGKTVAVALFRNELPATGYDASIEAYEVANGRATSLGTIGEFNFFEDSGPYPDRWFYLNFSGGRLYADVWNAETRCDKKHDWIASTYTVRDDKLVLINQLRHHRGSLPFACAEFITPSPQEAAYNHAVGLEDGKHDASAAAAWTKVLKMTPNDPDALDYRAHDYVALGQYGRAVEDFTREIAARGSSGTAPTYNSRAAAYYHLGMYKAALADFTSAVNLAPRKSIYYNNRATLLFKLGRYSEAARDFATVFKLTHDRSEALLVHVARSRAGEKDDAEFAANTAAVFGQGKSPDLAFQLYEGRIAPQDVISAGKRMHGECGAYLFVAEWQILQHRTRDAHANLVLAKKYCLADTVGGYLAAAELERFP